MIPCTLSGAVRPPEDPTVHRDTLESRFGPALYDLSLEQLATLFEVVAEIHERWCDKDESAERDAATTAAFEHLRGEVALRERGHTQRRARVAERLAVIASQQAALMSVRAGQSESTAAQDAGLDRLTLRRMLGKR